MLPYHTAFHWVRRHLLDHPAAMLTTEWLQRASGVGPRICQQVLADLVRSGFLVEANGGGYTRRLRGDVEAFLGAPHGRP